MVQRIAVAVVAVLLTASTTNRAQSFPVQCGSRECRAALDTARSAFGSTLTQQQAGVVLARAAWELRSYGFGLLRKDSGNRCPIPNSAVTVSCDWLVHAPSGTGCDVLQAGPDDTAPGPSTPTWCSGEPVDMSRFVAPVDPGTGGDTNPPNCAAEVAVVQKKLNAAVASLSVCSSNLKKCEADTSANECRESLRVTEQRAADLEAELNALKARPPATCQLDGGPAWVRSVFGIRCKVVQP